MFLLRNLSWLIVLAIGFSAIAVPIVRAQTTSVTNVQAPSHALVGKDVTVTVTVSFDLGTNGYGFTAFIWDKDTHYYATGTASSLLYTCVYQGAQYANTPYCVYHPTIASGSDVFTFELKFDSSRIYNLQAGLALWDSQGKVISGSLTFHDFSITVSNKVDLNVHAQFPVVVTIDDVAQSPGNVFATVDPGTHTLSVPSTVQVDGSTRLRFDRWDDGSTQTTRSLDLQDDTTLTAVYVTEYRLDLVSPLVNATGAGWYASGSTATFSAPSRFLIWTFQ